MKLSVPLLCVLAAALANAGCAELAAPSRNSGKAGLSDFQKMSSPDPDIEMSGRTAEAIYAATKAFLRDQKNFDCFSVDTSQDGENISVGFSPKQRTKEPFEDGAPFYLGGGTNCGNAVTYTVSPKGKVIGKQLYR